MNVSSRLILLLTLTVGIIMIIATWITSRQQTAILENAAQNEIRAHAVTLQIAIEEDYATNRSLDAQRLIDRLRENAGIYGGFLFDSEGKITTSSNPTAPAEIRYMSEARQVIATGKPMELSRQINGVDVFSVIVPLRKEGVNIGALEIAQSVSFVKILISKAHYDLALTAMALGLAIFFVVLLVTHFSLTKPVRELLKGALAMGRGDLSYRVAVPRSGELAFLAREFNRMGGSLAEQRQATQSAAEQQLTLERRLRHSERLALVGRLAAGVAHELGAPLQVIDGRAKQLLNQPEAPLDLRQRNLTIIRTQGERITRIVRQLLNLARPYQLKLKIINLSGLIDEVIEIIEPEADRYEIEIDSQVPDDLQIEADAQLLHQVFLNLIRNALQAIISTEKENGAISIITETSLREGRQYLLIKIHDTGSGIATEYLPQLFDPFFTTKEIGQGTGLGLAVASRIIEEHNGMIEAENNEFGGATFTISLPLKTENL